MNDEESKYGVLICVGQAVSLSPWWLPSYWHEVLGRHRQANSLSYTGENLLIHFQSLLTLTSRTQILKQTSRTRAGLAKS
jgi:hypothetical protein